MGFLKSFGNGYAFVSKKVFKHQGAYALVKEPPRLCDKCSGTSGTFHAHGRYQRSLTTLKNRTATKIKIWINRWLCLHCGKTMIQPPPDVIHHVPNCTLIITALLWGYLDREKGLYHAIPEELDGVAEPGTLARYLRKAGTVAEITQQAIREVLIQIKEPEPWDKGFIYGLPPPRRQHKRFARSPKSPILWRAIAILVNACEILSISPCLIMARARHIMRNRRMRFLF